MNGPTRVKLMEEVRAIVPPLGRALHKGAAGKLGVFGGSLEYCGAPFFAAITALRTGVDLAHIICTEQAAPPIKSFSPDIIVHPLLPTSGSSTAVLSEEDNKKVEQAWSKINEWLPRFTGLVLGPGLGRDWATQLCAKRIIEQAKQNKMPLVIDGDGISSVVCQWPTIIQGYQEVVLTPNFPEYKRLCAVAGCKDDVPINELCKKLGNVTIVQKGETDKISNGEIVIECDEEGSPRRCGGQGDITSGAIGTFLQWAHAYKHKDTLSLPPNILAAYAGCVLTRKVNKAAFAKKGRSTLVTDMIDEIGAVFADVFEKPPQ